MNCSKPRFIVVSAKAGISICLSLALLTSCSTPDREARLRDTIHAMAEALETHQAEPFLEHVAEDFTGDGGAWDARRAKRFVLGHVLRKDAVSITLNEIAITLHDDRATAIVAARIAGAGHWWPERGAGYRFQTGWRLEEDEWMVIRADWEQLR